jgi:hypothetical protein
LQKVFINVLVLIGLLASTAKASTITTADTLGVYYHTFDKQNAEEYRPDTSLLFFHQYHPALASGTNRYTFYDLGNIGLPIYSLESVTERTAGFNLGRTASNAYLFSLAKIPIYEAKHPFSELGYQTGQFGQTMIQALHIQPIGKNVTAQINYRYQSSDGVYQLQKTLDNNFFGQLVYHSPNKQFHTAAGTLFNKLTWQENGGNTNDSAFLINYINKNVVPVKMANTTQSFKEETFFFKQQVDFGKKIQIRKNDTTVLNDFVAYSQVQYKLVSTGQYQHYSDRVFDSLNYLPMQVQLPSIDTFNRKDSLVGNWLFHQYSNTLSWSSLPIKKWVNDSTIVYRKWLSNWGIQSDYIIAKQPQVRSVYANLSILGSLQNTLRNNYLKGAVVKFNWNYYLTGYNQNDYQASLLVASPKWLNHQLQTGLELSARRTSAPWLFQQLVSTGNPILNILGAESKQQIQWFLKIPNYHFQLQWSHQLFQNYLYLDSTANAANFKETLYAQKLQANWAFQFHSIHFLQYATLFITKPYPLQLPSAAILVNWYYEKAVFKKALVLQTGICMNWRSAFQAPNYSPLWNEFYFQNTSTYHQLPITDVYVSLKVKSARIFLKMENALQGINGQANYASLWYPMSERAIKVGVNWRFDDY